MRLAPSHTSACRHWCKRAVLALGKHFQKAEYECCTNHNVEYKSWYFSTARKTQLKFLTPEFNIISWVCHVDYMANASSSQYNMILGQDLLQALGLILVIFNDHTMTWDEAIQMMEYCSIPTLHAVDTYCYKNFATNIENEVTTRMTQILDLSMRKPTLLRLLSKVSPPTNS